MTSLAQLLRRREGFSLLELMIVVLILTILLAIGLPQFMGARKRAQRQAVTAVLTTTAKSEHTYYADTQNFTENLVVLNSLEPNIEYTNGPSTDPSIVSVDVGGDFQTFALAGFSRSKDCFYIFNHKQDGTTVYSKTEDGTQSSCLATVDDLNGTGVTKFW